MFSKYTVEVILEQMTALSSLSNLRLASTMTRDLISVICMDRWTISASGEKGKKSFTCELFVDIVMGLH